MKPDDGTRVWRKNQRDGDWPRGRTRTPHAVVTTYGRGQRRRTWEEQVRQAQITVPGEDS